MYISPKYTARLKPRGCLGFEEMAPRIGVSIATATRIYNRAMSKLRKQPGSFEGLLLCIHAVAAREKQGVRCGSVECQREWIELFGEDCDA